MKSLRLLVAAIVLVFTAGCVGNPALAVSADQEAEQKFAIDVSVKVKIPTGNGSGVVVYQDEEVAYVFTAAHVVVDSFRKPLDTGIFLLQHDRVTRAEVVLFHLEKDIAILKAKPVFAAVATVATFDAEVDDVVITYGWPYGKAEFGKGKILDPERVLHFYGEHWTLLYCTLDARPGMSGSGIFATRDGDWFLISLAVRMEGETVDGKPQRKKDRLFGVPQSDLNDAWGILQEVFLQ